MTRTPDLGGINIEDLRKRIQDTKAARPGRKAKAAWVAPEVDDFADGAVLAFDQTLGKTGVAVVLKDSIGIRVLYGDLLRPEKTGLKGFEDTFAKAERMGDLIAATVQGWGFRVGMVVHEMPAVQGYRLESSLMAAREVRRAVARYCPPSLRISPGLRMLSRNAAYATLTGAPSHEKKHMTAAVERLIPAEQRTAAVRWNQDVHDAVGLALKHLYDQNRAGR